MARSSLCCNYKGRGCLESRRRVQPPTWTLRVPYGCLTGNEHAFRPMSTPLLTALTAPDPHVGLPPPFVPVLDSPTPSTWPSSPRNHFPTFCVVWSYLVLFGSKKIKRYFE